MKRILATVLAGLLVISGVALSKTASAAGPTLVQSATGNGMATFSAPPTAGDLVVVACYAGSPLTPTTVTDNAGNVYGLAAPISTTSGGTSMGLYYASNIKSVSSFAVSCPGYYGVAAAEYSGTAGLDLQGPSNAFYSQTPTSGNITSSNGDLVVSAIGEDGSATLTPGSGWINRVHNSNVWVIDLEDRVSTGVVVNGNGTYNSNTTWRAAVAAFKPSGVQPSPSPSVTPTPTPTPTPTTTDGWIFFGDSITYQSMNPNTGGFDDLVHAALPSIVINQYNEGLIGRSTTSGLSDIGPAISRHPGSKYIAISLGTNDAGQNIYGCYTAPDVFRSNYTALINSAIDAGLIPVVPTMPTPQGLCGPTLNQQIQGLYGASYHLGKQPVRGPDLYAMITAHPEYVDTDGIHMNAAGIVGYNQAWAAWAEQRVYASTSPPVNITNATCTVNIGGVVQSGACTGTFKLGG